jgi:hypothetical protein
MKKITILQTRKNITYIVFAISFTFCLLFFGPYEIGIELNNIAAICIALLIQSVIAIRKFKNYTFNIDDKEIKWRFPDMKKEKTIFVSGGIKNVKENWMGFTFNSNNEKHEVRTESIWRKDKKNILLALKEIEKVKAFASQNLKQEDSSLKLQSNTKKQ